jgi:hypothetical protein
LQTTFFGTHLPFFALEFLQGAVSHHVQQFFSYVSDFVGNSFWVT